MFPHAASYNISQLFNGKTQYLFLLARHMKICEHYAAIMDHTLSPVNGANCKRTR